MESLRLVVCGRPECRRLFQLCSRCDRGQRYCERRCGVLARAESVRGAGRRYQRTRDGRHAHAERQAAYRVRRQKVTHQAKIVSAYRHFHKVAASEVVCISQKRKLVRILASKVLL